MIVEMKAWELGNLVLPKMEVLLGEYLRKEVETRELRIYKK